MCRRLFQRIVVRLLWLMCNFIHLLRWVFVVIAVVDPADAAVKLNFILFGTPMMMQINVRNAAGPPNSRRFRALMVSIYSFVVIFKLGFSVV